MMAIDTSARVRATDPRVPAETEAPATHAPAPTPGGGSSPSAHPARGPAWVALAGLLVALSTLPGGFDLAGAGTVATLVDGEMELQRGDDWVTLTAGAVVRGGDVVRTRADPARLETADGALSLAGDTRARLQSDSARIERGAVLFAGTRRWSATVGLVAAHGEGTWRVDATGAPRVAVYRGSATVADPAHEHAVDRLREVSLADGTAAQAPQPLRYLASDPWDRRLLADALAVDRFVAELSAALRLRYGRAPQSRAFYADFVAVDDATARALGELSPRGEGGRLGPPAGVLVGALMVDLVDARTDLDRRQALADVISLRRRGAAWGLVAGIHGLSPHDVRGAADAALLRRQQQESQGSAAPVAVETPADEGLPPGGGDTPDAGGTVPNAGSDASPGPGSPGSASGGSSDGTDDGGGDTSSGDGSGGDGSGDDGPGGDPGDVPDSVDRVTDVAEDVGEELPDPGESVVDQVTRTVDRTADEVESAVGSDVSGEVDEAAGDTVGSLVGRDGGGGGGVLD